MTSIHARSAALSTPRSSAEPAPVQGGRPSRPAASQSGPVADASGGTDQLRRRPGPPPATPPGPPPATPPGLERVAPPPPPPGRPPSRPWDPSQGPSTPMSPPGPPRIDPELLARLPEQLSGQVHVVEAGDTLSAIAARYGVDVNELYELNRATIGPDPNLIEIGMRLLIPAPADDGG